MANVLGQIAIELERQDKKWSQQDHSRAYWLAILMEEVGEAARAAVQFQPDQYRQELIEVAAVAYAAIEALDRQEGEL